MFETENAHVQEDHPGERNGQLPFFALDRSLDVSGRKVVGKVHVQLDVLAVGWVVDHVENEAALCERLIVHALR